MDKEMKNIEREGYMLKLPMDFVAGLIDALLSQKVTKLEHDKASGKLTITFGTGDLQSTQETTIQIPEYEVATTSQAGLMSSADKTKLDGITTATTSKDGLMSSGDKTKLDGYPTKTGSTTTYLRGDGTFATPPDNDTHYEGLLVAGASNTTTNAATTNGNTYLKFIENKVKKSGLKISGSGATTVTSDANGNITINSAVEAHNHSATDINTGTLPVARGGTGQSSLDKVSVGSATTATKLATARTIQTNLESTSSASFDGSGNVTPGVKGILPIANGGTGTSLGLPCETFSGNLDELNLPGIYFYQGCTNLPPDTYVDTSDACWGVVIVLGNLTGSFSTLPRVQILFANFKKLTLTSDSQCFYYRSRYWNGQNVGYGWLAWKKFTGNLLS